MPGPVLSSRLPPIAQHYGLSCIGQDLKDAAANFDGSNAALIGFVACHCQLVKPF